MAMPDDEFTVRDFMPEVGQTHDFMVNAGTALSTDARIATPDDLIAALRTVFDPEIPVNIYDLGLVYLCDIDKNGGVTIEMTLTAPGCPVAGEMPQWVADAVAKLDGVGEVQVSLVWDPPWDQEKMSDEAKLELGMF
jgi:FeS assembly SUF system protein